MLYRWKVRLLKTRFGEALWRRWRVRQGEDVADIRRLPEYIRAYAPNRRFVDIGCMWGVNGEYAFIAEEAGASSVKGVDVFGPTPEFEKKKQERNSAVEFILGDAGHPETIRQVGVVDVVFCAGVLYHHPSPFDLLVALRRMCAETLILRTATIPEIRGLPNAAIYYPMLPSHDRRLWNLAKTGLTRQVGITDGFEPGEGFGNWFWGMTPSCVAALLGTAGFQVDHSVAEPFAHTFICRAAAQPLVHRLPEEIEAREMGVAVSAAGVGRTGYVPLDMS